MQSYIKIFITFFNYQDKVGEGKKNKVNINVAHGSSEKTSEEKRNEKYNTLLFNSVDIIIIIIINYHRYSDIRIAISGIDSTLIIILNAFRSII